MVAVWMGILLGLVGLAGLFVWMIRRARRLSIEAEAAIARFAESIGAPAPDRGVRDLKGTIGGRRCTIDEIRSVGSDGTALSTRLKVEVDTPITFELHGQQSSLGARLVGDVEIGDAEFDKWFIIRTSDKACVAEALTPRLRRQFIDWYRSGWILRVWIKDDFLQADVGEGLQQPRHIEYARQILEALCRLAEGLDAPGVAVAR